MNVARKVVIASSAAVFLVPDEHSVIFKANNDTVFHNGYRSCAPRVSAVAALPHSIRVRGGLEQHTLACIHCHRFHFHTNF